MSHRRGAGVAPHDAAASVAMPGRNLQCGIVVSEFMSRGARIAGVARSLGMYYGIPLRARRLERFYSEFVRPGSLCFDIGAHAGNRIRCWRRLGARVLAVEPQAEFARLLHLLYGRDARVTIERSAVGRSPDQATLLVSERTPTVTSLSPEWVRRVQRSPAFRAVRWSAREEVEVTTLDALIAEHGPPRFVKIDVEGYEAEVLAGLSTAIPSLSFECLPVARHVALECVDRLAALGHYEYNWSPGESHALSEPRWLDRAAIWSFIEQLPDDARSGDVYARLTREGRGA